MKDELDIPDMGKIDEMVERIIDLRKGIIRKYNVTPNEIVVYATALSKLLFEVRYCHITAMVYLRDFIESHKGSWPTNDGGK